MSYIAAMQRVTLLILSLFLLSGPDATTQLTRNVLFLGNSYTGYNNLPQLVKDVALSAGDTLIFDNRNPGGYTLEDHSLDPTSGSKIMAGGWHYMVLQGQSREPIIENFRFKRGAQQLNRLLKQHDSCAVPLLYMTWGRKNGDAAYCPFYPDMCTYQSMDSALRDKYLDLADVIDAEVSPVSVVWHNLRQNHPSIELYQPDGSHPSAAGSYAAACCFYTAIFKKDPSSITFNYSLSTADAAAIRNAAKTEVYDSLQKWDYQQLPHSEFQYNIGTGANEVMFNPISMGVSQSYHWDFGDGSTSTLINPTHSYVSNGTYTVTLTTTNCNLQGAHSSISDTVIEFCSHTPNITISKAWLCNYDTLWTQAATAYQWYSGGVPIPETRQFLPDYQRYTNLSNLSFSVRTTVNGCSELSQIYYASSQWPGYFFDATAGGDPCDGDTAIVALLHAVGLSGSEIIRWYKNSSLLPSFNDEDTLLINTPGTYQCQVINPNSDCPFDTTYSGILDYNCSNVGIAEPEKDMHFSIYPNPASELLTIEGANEMTGEEIRIYTATGNLIKTVEIEGTTQLNISDLPNGLYYLLLQNHPRAVLKFIKQ